MGNKQKGQENEYTETNQVLKDSRAQINSELKLKPYEVVIKPSYQLSADAVVRQGGQDRHRGPDGDQDVIQGGGSNNALAEGHKRTRRIGPIKLGGDNDDTVLDPHQQLTPGKELFRKSRIHHYKDAVQTIQDKHKEYLYNLKMNRELARKRDQEEGRGVKEEDYRKFDEESKQVGENDEENNGSHRNEKLEQMEKTNAIMSLEDAAGMKVGSHQTFYDNNMIGIKQYFDSISRPFKYTLENVKAIRLNDTLQVHQFAENFFFKTIYNYKLDTSFKEEGCLFVTVFTLPSQLKLAQTKIRLLALQKELLKVTRADSNIKEIEMNLNETRRRTMNLEDSMEREDKNEFQQEFKVKVMNDIGISSVYITKNSLDKVARSDEHVTLICPDITSFQLRTILQVQLGFRDAITMILGHDQGGFDYFKLTSTEHGKYNVVKSLHFDSLKSSWNPLFYMMQEFKMYRNHLYHKQNHKNILGMLDYYLTSASSGQFSSICFIYEEFTCTLRDIMEDRYKSNQQFTVTEIAKIFSDVIRGLCTLHKLGIVHRNLRPENIVFCAKKNSFMISDLSLALVFNKEEAILSCFDLVGTPFYMPIDAFADLSIDGTRIKFSYDPFKGDVYAVGVMMLECLWINLQVTDQAIPQIGKAFIQLNLSNLEDLIKLCEQKHKQHNLFLWILRRKSNAPKRSVNVDVLRNLLENLIFEDSDARYDAYQAKRALLKIYHQEIESQGDFHYDDFKIERNLIDFSQVATKKEDMFKCLKNSLFLKDIGLMEKADILDRRINGLWDEDTQTDYKEYYIQFVTSRITNLFQLNHFEDCLKIIAEQLRLYRSHQSDPEYTSMALQCLMIKNKIMFDRNNVVAFMDTSKEIEKLINLNSALVTNELNLVRLQLNYQEFMMNYYLMNDKECLNMVQNFIMQLRVVYSKCLTDPYLVVNCFLIDAILDPTNYESKLNILRDFESKISVMSKQTDELIPQIYVFQVYCYSIIGNNISAYDISKKLMKIISGNFDESPLYNLMGQVGVMLASTTIDFESAQYQVIQLEKAYEKLKDGSSHNMFLLFYMIKYLLIKYSAWEDLKRFLSYEIGKSEKDTESCKMEQLRNQLHLIDLLMKDLQYEKAYDCYQNMLPYIAIIEKHTLGYDKLYWMQVLEAQIRYEQGMFYDATQLLEGVSVKLTASFEASRCSKTQFEKLESVGYYHLVKCHIKTRNFAQALPLVKKLLKRVDSKLDSEESQLRVLLACMRVILAVKPDQVEDVDILKYINMIIREAKQTSNPFKKLEYLHFLSYHVYLRLNKIQRAKDFMEESHFVKMVMKESTKKSQQNLWLTFRRKKLRLYLKLWSLFQTDQKVVERILRLTNHLVKDLSMTPTPYDKMSVLKSFITISKAYLSLGLVDDGLINISKAIVSVNSFSITGMFLPKSKIDFLFAKIHLLRHRNKEALESAKNILLEYQKFYGENSPRTREIYSFLVRACKSEDQNQLKYFEDTRDDEELSPKNQRLLDALQDMDDPVSPSVRNQMQKVANEAKEQYMNDHSITESLNLSQLSPSITSQANGANNLDSPKRKPSSMMKSAFIGGSNIVNLLSPQNIGSNTDFARMMNPFSPRKSTRK